MIQWLAIGLVLLTSVMGCGTINVARTVGLPGLPPIADADQVKLVEEDDPVSQPYQIVGQVTLFSKGGGLPGSSSYKRMKEVAAGMGANGLIGVRRGFMRPDVPVRSGLAVKWLLPGESRQPLTKPFLVAVLPVAEDPEAPGNQTKIAEAASLAAIPALATKGYYVLNKKVMNYKGGVEDAKTLEDAELRDLLGEDIGFLLEVGIVEQVKANIIVNSTAGMTVRTKLFNLRKRSMVYLGAGRGYMTAGFLVNMMVPNDKWIEATTAATQFALKDAIPIHELLQE